MSQQEELVFQSVQTDRQIASQRGVAYPWTSKSGGKTRESLWGVRTLIGNLIRRQRAQQPVDALEECLPIPHVKVNTHARTHAQVLSLSLSYVGESLWPPFKEGAEDDYNTARARHRE
jgi:hypothetical protein